MPLLPPESLQQLSTVNGFVRSRKRGDSHYVVFERQPEELQAELSNGLGFFDARCTRTSLEETFVSLVGGEL